MVDIVVGGGIVLGGVGIILDDVDGDIGWSGVAGTTVVLDFEKN